MDAQENNVFNETVTEITDVNFCEKDMKEPKTKIIFDGIAERMENGCLKPDESFLTAKTVIESTNDFSPNTVNLNEENVLKAFIERKGEQFEFNERNKVNGDLFDKCNGSLIDSKNDLKVPLKSSELLITAEHTNKEEDECNRSKFNNGISSVLQNENLNNLKVEAVCEEKKVKSKSCTSEKKMVKSTLKRKRAKSRESGRKSKMSSIKTTNENNKHVKKENSFDKQYLNNEQGKPKLKKQEGGNFFFKGHNWTSDLFEINIPLVGKNVMVDTNDKPFTARYDLAKQINEKRFRHQKKEGFQVSNMSYKKWREQQNNRSEKEKEIEAEKEQRYNLAITQYVTRITVKILRHLQSNSVDEKRVAKLLIHFLHCPVTPTSLLYVPHFVHAMMLCRGQKELSRELRWIANECYYKCHCMFPVPVGYNFETVYTSVARKFHSDSFYIFDDIPLDYGDFSDSDNSDSDSIKAEAK